MRILKQQIHEDGARWQRGKWLEMYYHRFENKVAPNADLAWWIAQ